MTGTSEGSYALEGFAVPAGIDAVHALLERAGAEHPEVDPTDLMLFETAVVEIANNVVEHARPAGEVRWRLTLAVHDGVIEAELVDSAEPFTPDLGATMPGPTAEGGRGLPLATSLLDTVRCTRADGGGNRWQMVRRFTRRGPAAE